MSADVAAAIAADKASIAGVGLSTAAAVDAWFDFAANRLPVYIAAIEAVEAICAELAESRGGWDAEIAATFRRALAVLAPSTDKEQQ